MTTQNFHILTIKSIGASNTLGSRIKIISERFEASKTIGYSYEHNNALDGAVDYLSKNGFEIVGVGEGKDHMYVITSTFKSPKN